MASKKMPILKCEGRYNVAILWGVNEGKYGPSPYFKITNTKKNKESGEYEDQAFMYLEDLYALQSLILRAINKAESVCADERKKEKKAAPAKEEVVIDDDEMPW